MWQDEKMKSVPVALKQAQAITPTEQASEQTIP